MPHSDLGISALLHHASKFVFQAQFEFSLAAVAEEVTAILSSLSN